MSKERKNLAADRLVADTYKALAREQAPEHLNEKVLRLASGRRSRYSLTRAWTRPVAWAATIGLSLALVLELNRLPQIEPEPAAVSASDRDSVPGLVAAPDKDGATQEGTAAARTQTPASLPAVDSATPNVRNQHFSAVGRLVRKWLVMAESSRSERTSCCGAAKRL